jgi:imidazolonepropionase-like amidohydrolase
VIDLVVTAERAWLGGHRLHHRVAVGVTGDLITWVGDPESAPRARTRTNLDGVLLPGLIDHHAHSAQVDLRAALHGGLTTITDLGWVPEEIWPAVRRSALPEALTPRIQAAGPILTVPGGYPTKQSWAPSGTACEIADPRSAAAAVRAIAAHHPVTIKVALDSDAGPVLDDATLTAVVAQACGYGLPVTAHVCDSAQTTRALNAGVRVLAHTPWTERLDDDLITRLAASTELISTIDIHGWGRDNDDRRTATDNLRRFHAAGGTVRYGTDLGNGPLVEGVNRREIAAIHAAGLSGTEILAAIAGSRLATGQPADLTVVPTDPLTDPSALTAAVPILKSGAPVVTDPDRQTRDVGRIPHATDGPRS